MISQDGITFENVIGHEDHLDDLRVRLYRGGKGTPDCAVVGVELYCPTCNDSIQVFRRDAPQCGGLSMTASEVNAARSVFSDDGYEEE